MASSITLTSTSSRDTPGAKKVLSVNVASPPNCPSDTMGRGSEAARQRDESRETRPVTHMSSSEKIACSRHRVVGLTSNSPPLRAVPTKLSGRGKKGLANRNTRLELMP